MSSEILPGVKIVDLCLYIEKPRVLVIGDLHLGFEEAMTRGGYLLPVVQKKEILKRIEKAMDSHKPKTVVLLGDLKHEFGRVLLQEWRDVRDLLQLLSHRSKVVVIEGNHDKLISKLTKDLENVEVAKQFSHQDMLFVHGDVLPEAQSIKGIKTIFMGHEHPAVSLRHGQRSERYKCFLLGKYQRRNLVVVPSFNLLVEGSDVTSSDVLSPLIKNVEKFEAFVVLDKPYYFGTVRDILRMN